jgi:hypothetical protein
MKRALLIFLLCILPLHASLAAVMEYCAHESAQTEAVHPGHHEHEQAAGTDIPPDPLVQAALDCAHHCFPALIPHAVQTLSTDFRGAYSPHPPADFLSAVLAPGERPPLSSAV